MSALDHMKIEDLSELKFAKLYSPKMKSVYWRHFGFPSNDNDDIITKQNVVCMICHKVLTNHGNTTNLRAHLQHRHKDLFHQICKENAIQVPQRKKYVPNPPVTQRNVSQRRVKLEYMPINSNPESDAEQSAAAASVMVEQDDSELYESMVPLTYDEAEEEVIEHETNINCGMIDVQSSYDIEEDQLAPTPNRGKKRRTVVKHETVFKAVPVDKKSNLFVQSLPVYQLNVSLMNIVVDDLRNVDTLFESGMHAFIRLLAGESMVPSPEKIEEVIREQHMNKFEVHSEYIKVLSHDKNYSLGFDLWTNVEHKRFLSIYFNYVSDPPNYQLCNQIYATVEYNEFTSIGEVLIDFDLQNCTMAVVNYDFDDMLKSFFKERNINIVLAYDFIVEKCLRQVFALPEVSNVVEQVKEVIQRFAPEINTKDLEVPIRNDDFLWTYYEWLKFFSERISWTDDLDNLVALTKTITDAIDALVIILETLKGEEIPYISMLAPVTGKILSKKLCISEQDETFAMDLKRTIRGVLQSHVMTDENLIIAALLDPRFHRLTQVEDMDSIVEALKKKSNEFSGGTDSECNATTTTATKENPMLIKRSPTVSVRSNMPDTKKSKLELLFDLVDTPTKPNKQVESSLETDLKRYRSEVFAGLDESPHNWWNKMGHIYSTLRQLVPLYQCVPGVVNLNFKKSLKQQVSEYTKRWLLSGDLVDAILFLNHHK